MPMITKRATAQRDLIAHYVYLAENANGEIADRFLANAKATFNVLRQQPFIGAPLTLRHPDLAGMRKWCITDFDNFLVFYIPRRDGVSIVRVLHAAQDWWTLLGWES
jgi:toxin ParE1/3/4